MNGSTIVVAGATGNLCGRIARALLERGASVRALVRHGAARDKLERLQELGATIASVDLSSASQVTPACSDASCVVSALAGLRDVIVEAADGPARCGDQGWRAAFHSVRLLDRFHQVPAR